MKKMSNVEQNFVTQREVFFSKTETLAFIYCLKNYPILYKRNYPGYNDSNLKNVSFQKLLAEVDQTIRSGLTIPMLKMKINTLYKQFTAEKKRELAWMKIFPAVPYRPTLWCFQQLRFFANKTCSYLEVDENEKLKQRRTDAEAFFTKDETIFFINLYKGYPNLYNRNHLDYNKHRIRRKSFETILEKMKELKPNTTLKHLKEKARTLYRQFSDEKRRKAEWEKKHPDQPYSRKLWCYKELQFFNEDWENSYEFMEIVNDKQETEDNKIKSDQEPSDIGSEDIWIPEPFPSELEDNDDIYELEDRLQHSEEFEFSRAQLNFFITHYKKYPFLYKRTHKDFSNIKLLDKTFEKILEDLKKIKSNATIQMLKEKAKTLRMQFIEETERKLTWEQEHPCETFESIYWYFDDIQFFDNNDNESEEMLKKSASNANLLEEADVKMEGINVGNSPDPLEDQEAVEFEILEDSSQEQKSGESLCDITARMQNNIDSIKTMTKEEAFCSYLCMELKDIKLEETFEKIKFDIFAMVSKRKAEERVLLLSNKNKLP